MICKITAANIKKGGMNVPNFLDGSKSMSNY